MKTRILAISMVVIAFGLSACGAQAVLPGDTEYKRVEDLKDALVAEGFPCSEWELTDPTSGKCNDDSPAVYLNVFEDSKWGKEFFIAGYKDEGARMGVPSDRFVFGKNWVVTNVPDPEGWAEKLGAKAGASWSP